MAKEALAQRRIRSTGSAGGTSGSGGCARGRAVTALRTCVRSRWRNTPSVRSGVRSITRVRTGLGMERRPDGRCDLMRNGAIRVGSSRHVTTSNVARGGAPSCCRACKARNPIHAGPSFTNLNCPLLQ
eukprot:3307422-Rhodomonas_salina.1